LNTAAVCPGADSFHPKLSAIPSTARHIAEPPLEPRRFVPVPNNERRSEPRKSIRLWR